MIQGFMHGINLGGWFSQCVHTTEHYDSFIGEEDIARIKNWGFDHVRLPVDYDIVEEADGSYKKDGFGRIQQVIDWCRSYDLNMVLDLHKTYGFSFDDGEEESGFFENEDYQERFYRLWERFAECYGKYADMLAFELLNEVTYKEYCAKWNEISAKCIGRIRTIAPDIRILIGGYYNNSIEALRDLEPPQDENIIYNFHCYEPIVFTHQGAYWVDGMDTSFRMPLKVTYGEYAENSAQQIKQFTVDLSGFDPDKTFGPEYFEDMVREAVKVAEERNVSLYCGEFGVIDRAAPEDTLEWYRMICAVFDKYGIGRAAWSYRAMDFGFTDERFSGVIDEIVSLI